MFTDIGLPRLLDRNFAIGHLLPAVASVASVWGILAIFGYVQPLEAPIPPTSTWDATLIWLITIWFVALLFLGLNYPILRFYEGYGRFHPLRWVGRIRRRRFDQLAAPALTAQAEIDDARARGKEPSVSRDHAANLLYAVRNFPDQREFVLPTRFGNIFRAAEVYSRLLYGLDAIPAWPRLLSVMPEHARQTLADSKAQLDFLVNTSFTGWIAALFYMGLAIAEQRVELPWFLGFAVLIGVGGYWLSLTAARNFGNVVMSSFDLYRHDLARQLGLDLPERNDDEHVMWRAVSRMMIYRSAERAQELERYRHSDP